MQGETGWERLDGDPDGALLLGFLPLYYMSVALLLYAVLPVLPFSSVPMQAISTHPAYGGGLETPNNWWQRWDPNPRPRRDWCLNDQPKNFHATSAVDPVNKFGARPADQTPHPFCQHTSCTACHPSHNNLCFSGQSFNLPCSACFAGSGLYFVHLLRSCCLYY